MTSDHLPAVGTFGSAGDHACGLSREPDAALGFALGYIAAQPVRADHFGGVCAVVEELMRRGVYDDLIARLPTALGKAVSTLYWAHRGMRWARTGVNRPSSG